MNVSVIIPAYNAAKTLAETLESLLAQTHSDWEAIVVDDGSKDQTAVIAASFAERDSRVRTFSQPQGGEAAARNAGIALARYDWLLFLDADDWISPAHLERMTGELMAHPELDAVHCGSARVAPDGTLIAEKYLPPTGDLFPTLARRVAFPIHACIVRRSLVESSGKFDTSLRTCPDWDLWQRIARMGARFGAVREVLAFYRMRPNSASLEAYQLFKDAFRVLCQGHAPDPRVKNPHADHANGRPREEIQSQEFYLLSWCAGLLLGSGADARPLLELVKDDRYSELYADAVAQSIFEAAPLPTCQPPHAWEQLWPKIQQRVNAFLVALENQSMAPNLAHRARVSLQKMILKHSSTWQPMMEDFENTIESQNARLEKHAQTIKEQGDFIEQLKNDIENRKTWLEKHEHTIESQNAWLEKHAQTIKEQGDFIEQLKKDKLLLEEERSNLRNDLGEKINLLSVEHDKLLHSPERRVGDILLNRLRLRGPLKLLNVSLKIVERLFVTLRHQLTVAELAAESRFFAGRGGRYRTLATVCTTFPIYSQTFVYQELTQLARHGFDVRLIYSKLDRRDYLQTQFARLWKAKRCMFINTSVHERDFDRYCTRMPEKVELLIQRLCGASGLTRHDLVRQGNFLQAFSFTRMVEAYRPHYLHSYFFYDRSLMALVASYLLDIPRGISCYADHLLKDYELKVVPLHLELCDVVIATSERIKQELLDIAPQANPNRILVKPNAIDTEHFVSLERAEPEANAPFRLVCVSRIEPKKGLLYLVEAVHLLRQRGLRVEAHLVGTTDDWSEASRDYKRKLDQRISELDLWGTVHLEGRQNAEGVLRFLRLAHLFVAPFVETESGDKDGIPTAVLEGMATGLPAVATDAGSITEVIDDGRDGVLVPQRDAVALANAIEDLLRDPDRRRWLSREAVDKVRRRFDVRVCEKTFHDRVRALIETR
jgi:glycosyltransferase involved in cell wall biosynthesis